MTSNVRYKGFTRGAEQPAQRPAPAAPPTTEEGVPIQTLDLGKILPLEAVWTGQLTVPSPGARVQLPDVPCRSASLRALSSNTGSIYLGNELVNSATGYVLSPGDALDLAIDNLRRLYIDAAVANEGICFLVVT
jgi:phosphatidylserine/phosphatidylglycerophosphate/cardiolipin synthase-like enzyme